MAEPFNSINGYTTGIPPVPVIDGNGNVITNVNVLSGNVSANKVYANAYFYANGNPLVTPAGGNTGELQFNNDGVLGGIAGSYFNGNILVLGNIAQVSITGGENGYFLQTDGTGNLTWAAGGNGGGGNATPAGANTQVQFNDAGSFGGDAGFTYNKITNTLHVENISAGDSSGDSVNIIGNISITGNIALTEDFNSNGNIVTSGYFIGNGSQLTGLQVPVANRVSDNAQPNITSLGTLVSLDLDGPILTSGNITTSGDLIAGNLSLARDLTASSASFTHNVTVDGNITVHTGGNLKSTGNINFAGAPNVNLGTLSNIHIGGGLNGYVLSTDGLGNLTWTLAGGGGNGTPGGNLYSVQYNDNGDFSGVGNFLYNPYSSVLTVDNIETKKVTLSGNLTVNATGNLKVVGNIVAGSSPNINLGLLSNVHIQGGTNGYVISTDGLGNLSWVAQGGANGGGVPGGSNTQVQYNNAGTFAASPYFTFNDTTNTVNVSGNLVANTMTLGSGVYQFSKTNVFFATTVTTSTTPLLTINAHHLSAVDFTIIGTDSIAGRRQYSKISAVIYEASLNYGEYSGLDINGQVGNYTVTYDPGNIIVNATLTLSVEPTSMNLTTHKIMITAFLP